MSFSVMLGGCTCFAAAFFDGSGSCSASRSGESAGVWYCDCGLASAESSAMDGGVPLTFGTAGLAFFCEPPPASPSPPPSRFRFCADAGAFGVLPGGLLALVFLALGFAWPCWPCWPLSSFLPMAIGNKGCTHPPRARVPGRWISAAGPGFCWPHAPRVCVCWAQKTAPKAASKMCAQLATAQICYPPPESPHLLYSPLFVRARPPCSAKFSPCYCY